MNTHMYRRKLVAKSKKVKRELNAEQRRQILAEKLGRITKIVTVNLPSAESMRRNKPAAWQERNVPT